MGLFARSCCADRRLSIYAASFLRSEALQARQQSYAQTPLAQSAKTKRNASLAERSTQAPAGVVSPSMTSGTSEPNNGVQLVQHTEPTTGQAYSVPREPMAMAPYTNGYGAPNYGAPVGYTNQSHGGGCQCCNLTDKRIVRSIHSWIATSMWIAVQRHTQSQDKRIHKSIYSMVVITSHWFVYERTIV